VGATVGVEEALVEGEVLGITLGSSDGGNDGIVLGATLGAPVDGTDDGNSVGPNDGVVEGISDGGGEGRIDWKVFPSSRDDDDDDDDDDDANKLLSAAVKPKNVMAPPITARIADMISIFQTVDRRLYAMTIELLFDGLGSGAAVWLLLFSLTVSSVIIASTFPCASSIGLFFLPSSPHFSLELLGSLRFLYRRLLGILRFL
jgi:hypothetical protein